MSVKKEVKSQIPLAAVEEKTAKAPKEAKTVKSEQPQEEGPEKTTAPKKSKKVCQFCTSSSEPKYWDVVALRRFMTDRGRIAGRGRYGTCAKHQRRLSREIKRARHLALLPFTVRV